MEDLITRRAAISTYKTLCSGIACKDCPFFDSKGMTDCRLLRALQKVQSAQPEIIRCKDCKHRIVNKHLGEKGYLNMKAMCELDTGDQFELGRNAEDDEWFCADAERRTDG